MDPSDPGEGPSRPRIPPKSPRRRAIQRPLSMVSDIELARDGDEADTAYPILSRTFSVSTGSEDGEESSLGVNTPPDSPESVSTFGGSRARSSGQRPQSLNSLTSPWRSPAIERYQERDSEGEEGDGEMDQESSTGAPESIGPMGQISVLRPALQRTSSAHTASSYALHSPRTPADFSDVPSVPAIPTPYSLLPHIDTQRISGGSSKEDWNERSVLKAGNGNSQHGTGTRPSSTHTASSYALYTPRSATSSKQVRFSGVPDDAAPPLPDHALEALARAHGGGRSPISPKFFIGPPPLFTSDEIPPPYADRFRLFFTNRRRGDSAPRFIGIKEKDPETGSEWSEGSCAKRRSKTFWWLVAAGVALCIFGIVVGVVAGFRKKAASRGGALGTNSTIQAAGSPMPPPPPPLSILGTWTYTTNLTGFQSDCAYNHPTTVWACYPFQNPISTNPAIFNFIIDSTDTGPNAYQNYEALTVRTPNNPFALNFGPIPLKLVRSLTDEYYTFQYNFTKTTIVNFNQSAAQCTFPHSTFQGRLWFDRGYPGGGPLNAVRHSTDIRGEWNGRVEIKEIKHGGDDQVVCQDRATQVVDYVGKKTTGTCLCQYANFDTTINGDDDSLR